MRLPQPFYRLPVRFDAERLRAEVATLPAEAWAKHPNHIAGNSSVRLISVGGGENDAVNGVMAPTPHLARMPYLRQVLASFGVVWSRSRLLRLAPGANVPEHADINYHWFNRVRLHVPIVTRPEVRFHCGDQSVHMAAGEAWLFDNWRLHRVENPTPDERIHLVADTSGSAAFWQFVAQSGAAATGGRELRFDPSREPTLLTERAVLAPVMTPAEVDLLILDLRSELVPQTESAALQTRLMRYHGLLDAFCRDWRQLYALHGTDASGLPDFAKLRDGLREASRTLGEGLVMRTNRVGAHAVLEGRVLRPMLTTDAGPVASAAGNFAAAASSNTAAAPPTTGAPATRAAETAFASRAIAHAAQPAHAVSAQRSAADTAATRGGPQSPGGVLSHERLPEPIFIIAAPRSGSTLLFETLAVSEQLHTLGGEGHELIEGLRELQPGAPGVDSNRLDAGHASVAVREDIIQQMLREARDAHGRSPAPAASIRFLEKTPKNALRIPFLDRIFPDARFIVLWRDPRENLGSIIDAWRSGRWKTYNGLPDFDGPWSLLLPPGWRTMNGRPLEEIAAFQWDSTYRIVLDDLAAIAPQRWTSVSYGELLADTAATIRRLCEFARIEFDGALAQHVTRPLPLSRYTLTPPARDKWRQHEPEIARVLPAIEATWRRLQALR
ncbi:MAG TPA: sulfotransferase [Steroidobacteraceae bacterium]|nr:sulfotransferase [Steroidobacteraceae bacterium]